MPPPISCRRRERTGDALVGISSGGVSFAIVADATGIRSQRMELSTRTVTLELAETFVIARESSDTVDLVEVEIRHDGLVGYGEAAPIDRYGETADSATAWLESAGAVLGDDPWALDEIHARLPAGEQAARGGARRGAARPLREAGGRSALPPARASSLRPAHVVDDLAGRPRRHGTQSRGGRGPLPPAEAQARRPGRPGRRARACGSVGDRRCRCRWT